MADQDPLPAEDSAEKAYAAASQALGSQSVPAAPAPGEPVAEPVVEPVPVVAVTAPAPAPASAETVAFPPKAARASVATRPAAPAKAPTKAKPPVKAKAPVKAKTPTKPSTPRPAASKPAGASRTAPAAKAPIPSKPKEMTMTDTKKFADGFQKIVSESQGKMKQAYAKGSAMVGEYGDFAKGNVEAVVESGKILATGLQGMGQSLLAETKTAIETATADVKQLAGAKSPTDFVKAQGDIMRRNLDHAVALTSKNSEAVLKLTTDAFAPISGRFTLAVAKFKKAA